MAKSKYWNMIITIEFDDEMSRQDATDFLKELAEKSQTKLQPRIHFGFPAKSHIYEYENGVKIEFPPNVE